jgi:stage IV sporulation protein A
MTITVQNDLFYKILGEATGIEIDGESGLMPCMVELARVKREYDKISGALQEVAATGYGIVMPSLDELTLEEPEIVRQGGRYGVKLRAQAPSIHMMRCEMMLWRLRGKVGWFGLSGRVGWGGEKGKHRRSWRCFLQEIH